MELETSPFSCSDNVTVSSPTAVETSLDFSSIGDAFCIEDLSEFSNEDIAAPILACTTAPFLNHSFAPCNILESTACNSFDTLNAAINTQFPPPIREYHRRHPIARVVDALDDPEELLKEEPRVEFSGEEAFGRYLDMHELYNEYVNSKFGQLIDYSAFLEEFPQTHNVPRNHKLTRQYKEYLANLLDYFISFFQRTQPLQDLDKIFLKVHPACSG